MRNDYVDGKPIDFDFSAETLDYDGGGEGAWSLVYPDLSGLDYREVRELLEYAGIDAKSIARDTLDEARGDLEPFQRAALEALEESDPDLLVPMMNYAYPIGEEIDTAEVMQAKLLDGCLCVVSISGSPWLALQGGGMDFSESICRAYMRLGFLPPAHFCSNLRHIMSRENPDRELIDAAQRSLDMAERWTTDAAETHRDHFKDA